MALAIATLLFAGYVSNVLLGAFGIGAVLSDVQEMIILFAASVAFTAAILKREAQARKNKE